MPPRASKRGASAKKPSPRAKNATRGQKPEVVPLRVVEENKVSESEVQSSPVEDDKSQEAGTAAEKKEIKQEEVVLVEKAPEGEVVPSSIDQEKVVVKEDISVTTVVVDESKVVGESSIDQEKVVVKEDISVTTVVVEESKVVGEVIEVSKVEEEVVVESKVEEEVIEESYVEEEVVVESKVEEEVIEESNVEEEVVEESNVEEEVVEEWKVVEQVVEELKVVEQVEEKKPEVASSNAASNVKIGETKPEIASLNDASDVEMKGSMSEEDPEEVDAEENGNEGDHMDLDKQVAKQDMLVKETAAAVVQETVGGGDGYHPTYASIGGNKEGEDDKSRNDDPTCANEGGNKGGEDNKSGNDDPTCANEGVNKEGEDDKSGSDDEDNEDDEDPTAYMQFPLTDRKKQKELEIFVGGLDKEAIEEDLINVFGKFGEIQAVRIVKHPTTQKSKGFAFIRYASVDQAKRVLAELKDGTEVRGKRVGISPSKDSDTLYVGNIHKTWTNEQVLEALKTFGIEQIEEMYLPDDPHKEGQSRGFALLEFSTHSDAMAAFQRLRKPDAAFGCDRSAKVAFAQSSLHPSEVRTVFVEGLTDSWDEKKLKEFCKQYGEIERVQLSRNLVTTRRKDFGFVGFTSRESAVACVEGINGTQIGEGDVKVRANLAKPQYRGRLGKQTARGGYKVKKDGTEEAEPSRMKGHGKSRGAEGKGKAFLKARTAKGGGKPFKAQGSAGERQGASTAFRTDRPRKEQPSKGGKRGGRNTDIGYHGRPLKKQRGNMHGRPTNGFGNQRNDSHFGGARQNHVVAPARYLDPYAQVYAPHAPASGYQGHTYGEHSGSKRRYSDMEPHAGYIEPATVNQGRDPYNYGMRRAGVYDGQGSSGTTAYGGAAGSVPQPSYVPAYPSYTAYGSGGSGSGSGYVYPSSGAYPPQQTYY